MKIHNTADASVKPPVLMLVYGQGGVGKTTFTSTAPKPILADIENGSKYFGLRGIKMDVALINSWDDIREFYQIVKASDYETVIIDPIGELMEKLKTHVLNEKSTKNVQRDGSLTIAGWGDMKDKMRVFIKSIRDLNKNMIIVAHVEEKEDDNHIIRRPKIMTKLSEELIALVDIVGFMEMVKVGDEDKRIIRVQPSDRYEGKDRTGQLGAIIEPDFSKIVNACQGTEVYAWSSQEAKEIETKTEVEPETTTEEAPESAPKSSKRADIESKLAK